MGNSIQEIIKIFLKKNPSCFNHEKNNTLHKIALCRSGAFGTTTVYCNDCHEYHHIQCSCGDRHCPVCQSVKQYQWCDNRLSESLNCGYSHIVFTVPHGLNYLFLNNELRKDMFNTLFSAASKAINIMAADKELLGGKVGFFAVLHTWDRQMNYHPHLHVLMPKCAITDDLRVIKPKRKKYIFPLDRLSATFKVLFLNLLKEKGIDFDKKYYSIKWVVYIKNAGDDKGTNVIEYLSRYVYRVAINDSRIVSYDNDKVTFKYKNRKSGEMKQTTISLELFVKRYALHILPKNFRKVRFYGFLSNRPKKEALALLRRLLHSPSISKKFEGLSQSEIVEKMFNIKHCCKNCGSTNLTYYPSHFRRSL